MCILIFAHTTQRNRQLMGLFLDNNVFFKVKVMIKLYFSILKNCNLDHFDNKYEIYKDPFLISGQSCTLVWMPNLVFRY